MSAHVVVWQQGRFSATRLGLRIKGKPPITEWSAALRALVQARDGTQWAIGDILIYADTRKFEDDAVEEIMDATGLKRATLMNHKSVARRFELPRRTTLPWSHHALLTSLANEAADALLLRAQDEAWGWEEVRAHARSARQASRRLLQECPAGTYGVLLATPPWPRRIGEPDAMRKDELAALAPQVQGIMAPQAVGYLVVPSALLPDGIDVLRAWGFRYEGSHVLVSRTTIATTGFMRLRHELLLVGVRGQPAEPEDGRVPDSVQELALGGPLCKNAIRDAFPEVPRVHLFALGQDEGWAAWSQAPEPPRQGRAINLPAEAVPA